MGDCDAMNKRNSFDLCSMLTSVINMPMLLQNARSPSKNFLHSTWIEKIIFLHPSAQDSIVETVNPRSQLLF